MALSPAAQAELAALNTRVETVLSKAFDLVDPSKANPGASWRDPIHAEVNFDQLTRNSLTLDDLKEAVMHYTATEATITYKGDRVFVVRARGYRAGPAGDH